MADNTSNDTDRTATEGEKSFDQTPKLISKYTLIMLAATALFIIISAILFTSFLSAPAGGSSSNSTNSQSR